MASSRDLCERLAAFVDVLRGLGAVVVFVRFGRGMLAMGLFRSHVVEIGYARSYLRVERGLHKCAWGMMWLKIMRQAITS